MSSPTHVGPDVPLHDTDEHRRAALLLATVGVIGGLVFGALDFVWIKYVPYPVAELGNSMAVWAVVAFAVGFLIRRPPVLPAAVASVTLVAAVVGYRLAGIVIQDDDVSGVRSGVTAVWALFGVIAGVVFGTAGALTHGDGWKSVVSGALAPAVLFAEATIHAGRIGNPSYDDAHWNAVLNVVLGLAVLAFVHRDLGRFGRAFAVSVPFSALGAVALRIATSI
jgi:Family of unknown function (DUF6518)